jgi:hypothetical protein
MTVNGDESVSNGNHRRDAKGRFLPGGPGGPGRKARKPITLAEIEQSLQDDLRNKDPKIRHNATKLLLLLKKAQLNEDESDKPSILDPRIQKVFGIALAGILEDPDVEEVEDE